MKRYLYILVYVVLSLILTAGCDSLGDNIIPMAKENTAAEIAATENTTTVGITAQTDGSADWEPTVYETVDNFRDVTMRVKEGTVSSGGSTLVFENESDSQCIYGDFYVLEKKISDGWYQVPVAFEGNYGFNSIGYSLESDADSEWPVDWEWLYGGLDTGEYRIIKDILDIRSTGVYETYYLTAEFTIKS